MTRFGYHASHEQHAPGRLLEYVGAAEEAGFEGAMCSDHLFPWLDSQGESGYAWSWLGAALQATSLSFGTVTAPGWRYSPVILAQAAATLASMYPDRLWVACGSGEALNENVTGRPWPPKGERNEHLRESVRIMRALWAGETVTSRGRIRVVEAKLYTRPDRAPMVLGAALSEATARFVGGWADGLMTIGGEREGVEKIVRAFRDGGGEGPVFVQHSLCWARTEAEAKRAAHEQWRFAALGPELLGSLTSPAQFEAASRYVTPEDVAAVVRISSSLERHAEWLHQYVEMGVDAVYCFDVGRNQRAFIEAFGERVLPQMGKEARDHARGDGRLD
jgi:probable non-F420 flavinoid oxidoreductase